MVWGGAQWRGVGWGWYRMVQGGVRWCWSVQNGALQAAVACALIRARTASDGSSPNHPHPSPKRRQRAAGAAWSPPGVVQVVEVAVVDARAGCKRAATSTHPPPPPPPAQPPHIGQALGPHCPLAGAHWALEGEGGHLGGGQACMGRSAQLTYHPPINARSRQALGRLPLAPKRGAGAQGQVQGEGQRVRRACVQARAGAGARGHHGRHSHPRATQHACSMGGAAQAGGEGQAAGCVQAHSTRSSSSIQCQQPSAPPAAAAAAAAADSR